MYYIIHESLNFQSLLDIIDAWFLALLLFLIYSAYPEGKRKVRLCQ